MEKNVEQCFTKFVNEGKATIRFIEPPYDVCLSKVRRYYWLNLSGSYRECIQYRIFNVIDFWAKKIILKGNKCNL